MKLFNLICFLLFVLFAALHYNDPDPYIWIPIYLYAAFFCWLAFRNKFYLEAYLIGITLYGVYALYLFLVNDGVLDWLRKHHAENIAGSMESEKPWIEMTREFFGLIILIIVLGFNYLHVKKAIRLKQIEP